MENPTWFRRTLSWFLGLDGFFHIIEMLSAIYEEAYITAGLLGFSAIGMFLACWILGDNAQHHHHL
jgi:hypothetical protein